MVLHSSLQPAVDEPPHEIRQLIFESLQANEERVFMIDGLTGTQFTYRELFEKATSIAIFLNRSGIGPGSYVAMLSDVLVESNAFLVGVWLSGASVATVNPALKAGEIRQLLEICTAKFIFCQEKYLGVLEDALDGDNGSTTVVVTNKPHETYVDVEDMMNEDSSLFKIGSYDEEESIMYVLFTSGTTGVPKGVMCSSRAAKKTVFCFNMKVAPFICMSPMYWISYIAVALWTIVRGTTLIVPGTKYISETGEVDLTHTLDCIQQYKPYNWFAGPSALQELCNVPSVSTYDLSSLGRVGVGGMHLQASQRKKICDTLFNGRKILFNLYGATEVGIISAWPDEEGPEHDSPRAASVGMLVGGFSLKVEDVATGAELGPGEIGEFVVKSISIMNGYMNKDMPQRYTPDDWYRMGDLGHYDEDGYLYFSSRLKETIKYRGYQIAPAELEKIITEHTQVQEVCVVGRPHTIDGERPAAFVVRKSGSLTEEELRTLVDENAGDHNKLRGGVFFVESIPKSGVGKVLRRDLLKYFEGMEEE